AGPQLRRKRSRDAQLDLRVSWRRHPQHPRVRARLSRHAHDRARAELPLDEPHPPRSRRRRRAQPGAEGEAALVGARRRRAGARPRARGRARGGAVRRRRDRRPRRARVQPPRDRRCLPDECAEPRARGRAGTAGDRLPGDRRAAFLRARRDQGCARLPAGDRQSVRRRLAAADREPASARARRHVARTPAGVRGRRGNLALGGGSPRRGGRAGAGVVARGAVASQPLQSLLAGALPMRVSELVARTLERSGYLEALEAERTVEARGRIENLEELVGVAREYEAGADEPALSSFLQEVSLYSDQDALRDDDDGGQVTLLTLHNAKGLEYRAVFVVGMEEGIFPHSRSVEENAIEEERRLCYVGMTRAKERLTLTHASRRSLYGRTDANLPSRFLDELPREGVERERLAPASWSGYGARREVTPRVEVPALSTGDNVRHHTLGAGVVTRIEADGVVTVRFEDGAERRLMLEYAPLERI